MKDSRIITLVFVCLFVVVVVVVVNLFVCYNSEMHPHNRQTLEKRSSHVLVRVRLFICLFTR